MKKSIKWIVAIVLVIGIIGSIVYSLVKPIDIETLEIQPQTVAQTFKEEGIAHSTIERPISSILNGTITHLAVKEGQRVKKGELLVEIESKELEYQLRQLKGQLESIKGQEKQASKRPYNAQLKQQQLVLEETKRELDVAKRDHGRIAKLYETGAVSRLELANAENQVAQLENSLRQQEQALKLIDEQSNPLPGTDQYYEGLKSSLESQIDQLQYFMDNRAILAPMDGVVTKVAVNEGEVIPAQSPLLMLAAPNDLEIHVYLLTDDVSDVKVGTMVELIQQRKDQDVKFTGEVKAIAPSAEEKVSALGLTQQKIKVTVKPDKNALELRPGYALDVIFITRKEENKLAVPKTILFPLEKGDGLFLVKNGRAVIQQIETGMETDDVVVIEKGLKAGDIVIKNPQQEGLEQGKRVK